MRSIALAPLLFSLLNPVTFAEPGRNCRRGQ